MLQAFLIASVKPLVYFLNHKKLNTMMIEIPMQELIKTQGAEHTGQGVEGEVTRDRKEGLRTS